MESGAKGPPFPHSAPMLIAIIAPGLDFLVAEGPFPSTASLGSGAPAPLGGTATSPHAAPKRVSTSVDSRLPARPSERRTASLRPIRRTAAACFTTALSRSARCEAGA